MVVPREAKVFGEVVVPKEVDVVGEKAKDADNAKQMLVHGDMIQAKEEALVGDNLIFEDTSRTREV
jgi:hypothetical protein